MIMPSRSITARSARRSVGFLRSGRRRTARPPPCRRHCRTTPVERIRVSAASTRSIVAASIGSPPWSVARSDERSNASASRRHAARTRSRSSARRCGAAIAIDRLQPEARRGEEGHRGEGDAARAGVHRVEDSAGEPHVVEQGHPPTSTDLSVDTCVARDELKVVQRFLWRTTTPFGADVEPEVYWRYTMSSAPNVLAARASRLRPPSALRA